MEEGLDIKVAVTIQEEYIIIKKGHPNSYLDRMLKLPLDKKIRAVKIIRKYSKKSSLKIADHI